jgi:hypothetical protein
MQYMFFKIRNHMPLMLIKEYIRDKLECPQLVVNVADVELIVDLQKGLLVEVSHPLLLLGAPAYAGHADVVAQDGA